MLSRTTHIRSVEVVSMRTASPSLLTNIVLSTVESCCRKGCTTASSTGADAGSVMRKPMASRT